jgi:predicted dehydrogenase
MKLKVGIVGAGVITGHKHLPSWKLVKNAEVVALCDQRESLAKELATKYGVQQTYVDMGKMLANEKLDIVDICTPPLSHHSLAIQAMEAGVNVLMEKPLATTVKEADEMISASKKAGVTLCTLHQNLFNPAVVKAKRLVENGSLGELINVTVQTFEPNNGYICANKNHWSHSLPGGIFCEILPHPIYLIQAFLRKAKSTCTMSRRLGNIEWLPKDEVRVLVDSENGLGSIIGSCSSSRQGDTLDIMGTKRSIKADIWGRTVIDYRPHDDTSVAVGLSNLDLGMQMFKVGGVTASMLFHSVGNGVKVSAHYFFIKKFAESISNGTEPPVSLSDARESVELLEEVCNRV